MAIANARVAPYFDGASIELQDEDQTAVGSGNSADATKIARFDADGKMPASSVVISGDTTIIKTSVTTSPYTILGSDYVLLIDATSGNLILTLPDPITFEGALIFKRIDTSANTVTVNRNAAENIESDLTAITLNPFDRVTLVSDGTDWWMI